MILGVGIDIVSSARIESLLIKFAEKFEKKVFTDAEILIAQKFNSKNNTNLKAKHYAKRFAAKESFAKAIGLGIGKAVNFTDIEIINDKNGKPEIRLSKKSQSFLQKHFQIKNFKIDVSLSDEPPIAQAIVIISSS